MLVSLYQLNTDSHIPGKWESQLRNWFSVGLSVRHFLIAGWHGKAQPTVCGTIPRQLGLGYIRKQAVQARRNKPVHSIPSWLLF